MWREHDRYLSDFLKNCRHMNKSAHTIKNYSCDLIKFLNWYEVTYQKRIEYAHGETITAYKNYLTHGGRTQTKVGGMRRLWFWLRRRPLPRGSVFQKPLAVNSRKRHLSAIKNFFEFLKQTHEDHGKKFLLNPVKTKLHSIRLKDVDVVHTPMLTQNDWEKIQEVVWRTRERVIIYLLYYAGMRLSEITFLKIEHIDFANKRLIFPRKGGKVHSLWPQNRDKIFEQLEYWLRHKGDNSPWVFSTLRGRPYSPKTIYNLVTKILARANVSGVSPHSFRKACATNLYLDSKDLLFVRDYLGHSDAKVTQTYIDEATLRREREQKENEASALPGLRFSGHDQQLPLE